MVHYLITRFRVDHKRRSHAPRTKKAGTCPAFSGCLRRSTTAGSVLDLLTGLLHILAGTGHGVAASQHGYREHGQQHQGNDTLHLNFSWVGLQPYRFSDPGLAPGCVSAPAHGVNLAW